MKLYQTILVLLTAFVLSVPVMADEDERRQYFNELDEDGNEVLDISEVEDHTPLLHDFPKIDKNQDNELDINEFSAFEPMELYIPTPPEDPEPGAAPTE